MLKELISNNIRRLMKAKDITIPILAKRADISPATISNILNQKSDTRMVVLERIAKALEISPVKFFEERESLSTLRFRTFKVLTQKEKALREILLFDIADKIQKYSKVEKLADTNRQFIFLNKTFYSPAEAAKAARTAAGIGTFTPIKDICHLISFLGIKLFFFKFNFQKAQGLSLGLCDGGPAIFVNKEISSVERLNFTFAHELGHIMLHKDSYKSSEEVENKTEEQEANEFAAELLCPKNVVYQSVKNTSGFTFIDTILKLKQDYSVGYETALRQYCRHYRSDYGKALAKFRVMYSRRYNHGFREHYEPNPLPEFCFCFSDPYLQSLVIKTYSENKINDVQGQELLNCTKSTLEQMVLKEDDLPF